MNEIPFARVLQTWGEVSEHKNTLGILKAFEPAV
jgi:hypothetical protein